LIANQFDPSSASFKDTDWIIGNHPDELAPWIGIIASKSPNARYFLLPCCLFDFVGKFNKKYGKMSRYETYISFLKDIGNQCGFQIQIETLKIPSTKNHALIARKRFFSEEDTVSQKKVQENIQHLLKGFSSFIFREPQAKYTPQKRFKPGTERPNY